MNPVTPSNDRFRELRQLLRSHEVSGYTFDDTEDRSGVALSAYLREAAIHPARAAEAAAEIDDLLATGLFNGEMADDVDLLPHIHPPQGRTVEQCLAVIGGHLRQFLAAPTAPSPSPPQTAWEWNGIPAPQRVGSASPEVGGDAGAWRPPAPGRAAAEVA
ncbi:hypothetical protein OHS33_15945 [Streptomyces sp. NBC_00536]|uniref:hypothetical protein n=1 Tax=Streptomyces sp. NBC_00536 TaxID=2975769 RepID=UPI002E82004C|nr:hypothetical protein [Streptomyces sp. NBC_00536]WUC79689.1 hypothetical protein OHS33_15945 [Streptomyces sp. NBC_00536]